MKTKQPKTKKQKLIKTLITVGLILVVLVGGFSVLRGSAQKKRAANAAAIETLTLEKRSIKQSVHVSGVTESSKSTSIYSTLSYPVKELYVEVGDTVEAGDVLALLDVENLQNDLKQAQINLQSARDSATEETRNLTDAVVNAKNALESAAIAKQQREIALRNAEKDLTKALTDAAKVFDSYTYDRKVTDTKITLERKVSDAAQANADMGKELLAFDSYRYQNEINDAEDNLARKQKALDDAKTDYDKAQKDYNDAVYDSYETLTLRTSSIDSAKSYMDSAERSYTSAVNSLNDAKNKLTRAKEDLKRARTDQLKAATDKAEAATKAESDARRAYNEAIKDREHAETDYHETNDDKIEKAEKALTDAKKSLEAAENTRKNAENTLKQTEKKPANADKSVQLQSLSLEKLQKQLRDGRIITGAAGVVTAVNTKVGATPQGVLFMIENKQQLYVSARVKEYHLNQLELGQVVSVTTDATGDAVYDATISYLSPKAVSEAGSTSVEFEVRATLLDSVDEIKIGMNAYLDIVLEEKENVFAVPVAAITTNDKGSFVYAVPIRPAEEDTKKKRKKSKQTPEMQELPVTLGMKSGAQVEITGDALHEGLVLLADAEVRAAPSGGPGGPFGGGPFGGRGG